MKKMLILLAVAIIPATLSGCANCCPWATLCPCCPCNWFNRPAPCPPAPLVANPCAPAPYAAAPYMAAPYAAAPTQMMPQYVMPTAAPLAAAGACASCPPTAMQQPMYYQPQPSYYSEPSCGYTVMEPSCGGQSMVSYGPSMDCGPCGGGCCEGGTFSAPSPAAYGDPRPAAE